MKKSKVRRLFISYFILHTSYLFMSCGVYSFTGTKLADNLKTIQIINFSQQTAGGPANLALSFTEKIKEYYQRNTQLKLVNINPDTILEGQITSYDVSPVAPTVSSGTSGVIGRTDGAGLNRLTVTIQVKYTNNKDESQSFDQSFSFYQDFPQTQTINQVESSLVPKIFDQIILDIFNKTAGDW
jgi:Lipopolysaccharide-assembly